MTTPGATKRVLAWFEGGHVEEWLEGATLPFELMMDEAHAPQIGALLARLHACPLPPDDASLPAAALRPAALGAAQRGA